MQITNLGFKFKQKSNTLKSMRNAIFIKQRIHYVQVYVECLEINCVLDHNIFKEIKYSPHPPSTMQLN